MAKLANVASMKDNNGLEVEPLGQKLLDENLKEASYGKDMTMNPEGKLLSLDSKEMSENKEKASKRDNGDLDR